jgi:hypothetical protein
MKTKFIIAVIVAITAQTAHAQLTPTPIKEPQSTWSANGGNIVYTFRKVGIGTSSPLYNLHVIGQTKISGGLSLGAHSFNFVPDVTVGFVTQDQIRSTNGIITFGNDAGSYSNILVGIGTTNPQQMLYVNGNINL